MSRLALQRFFESASVCDCGLVRPENQDSILVDGARGVFVVADGMGGGQGGAQASELVIEAVRREFACAGEFLDRAEAMRRAIDAANDSIREFARRAGFCHTGSTIAAFLAGDAVPGPSLVTWIGDSRVYRLRDGKLLLLTRDHTVANEFSGRGRSDGAYDRTRHYAHVLTRALGAAGVVQADWRRCEIRCGDRLLICSDGVYDMLAPEVIRELLAAASSPQDAVRDLSRAVRAAGAHDNFSAIPVFVREEHL